MIDSVRMEELVKKVDDLYKAFKACPYEQNGELPKETRRKLLVMGSSFIDFVFWVRRENAVDGEFHVEPIPHHDEIHWKDLPYYCEEIETGIGSFAWRPENAIQHYFEGTHRGAPMRNDR